MPAQTEADKEILKKLSGAVFEVTQNLDNLALHQAAQAIYQFTWHELADIYLETGKIQLKNPKLAASTSKILAHCLTNVLKLLHPFMPFITEEIWSKLPLKNKKLLIIEKWPLS